MTQQNSPNVKLFTFGHIIQSTALSLVLHYYNSIGRMCVCVCVFIQKFKTAKFLAIFSHTNLLFKELEHTVIVFLRLRRKGTAFL